MILEAGAFGSSADWDLVLHDLAKDGRVCAYDRLGLGRSSDRQNPPTAEQIADDLAVMLDLLGETQPVVLVGHSNGAFYAETFAIKFPERVAGIAYVDGVGTDDLDNPRVMSDLATEETLARLAVWGGRTGLLGPVVRRMTEAMGLRGQAAAQKERALTSLRHLENARDEVLEIVPALRRVRGLGAVAPAIPTAVIVASLAPDAPDDQAWRSVQIAPAQRACQGWVLDAVGSSHVAPLGRDRAYVLAAVRWLQTPGLRSAQSCSDLPFKR